MKIWLLKFIGFLLGAGIGLFLVALTSFLTHRIGLAVIIIPVMTGVIGANLFPRLCNNIFVKKHIANFWTASPLIRTTVIAPFFWAACVGAFVWIFEPYGSYMSTLEMNHMYKVMSFPALLLGFGFFIYAKLINPKK